MLRTILTPLDGSANAQMALELAIDLAANYKARLVILHIGVGNENVPEELFNATLHEFREAEGSGQETGIPPHQSYDLRVFGFMGRTLLHDARQLAKSKGVEVIETTTDLGDAGERILHHAKQSSADLIVMGSRGLGEIKGLALGSVSNKVLHLAPCSCVTVHHKGEQGGQSKIERILVPTDGSGPANRAVEMASDIAAKIGAKLDLLYVMWRGPSLAEFRTAIDMSQLSQSAQDALDPGQHPVSERVSSAFFPPVVAEDTLKEIGEQILEHGRGIAKEKGVECTELVLLDGDPARKIAQVARSQKADLIVMGSRGLGAAESILSGSVSYKVNHAAPCSCMVVR